MLITLAEWHLYGVTYTTHGHLITPLFWDPCLSIKYYGIVNVWMISKFGFTIRVLWPLSFRHQYECLVAKVTDIWRHWFRSMAMCCQFFSDITNWNTFNRTFRISQTIIFRSFNSAQSMIRFIPVVNDTLWCTYQGIYTGKSSSGIITDSILWSTV